MTQFFEQILRLSITGSYTIIFILAIRFLLKKAPKIFSYILWAVVLFRLICPYSFTLEYSLVPEKVSYPQQIELFQSDWKNEEKENISIEMNVIDKIKETGEQKLISSTPELIARFSWVDFISFIWGIGILTMISYSLLSFFLLKKRIKDAVCIGDMQYQSSHVVTPFIIGIVKPKIYLPRALNEEEKNYILLHEIIHIQRKDHIIKPIAFLVLTLHWFNPLVWVAYYAMSEDMEMSCDEAVIKRLGNKYKKDYSCTILKMAAQKTVFNASPLAFSNHYVKDRIKNVLNYRKPAIWIVTVIVLVISALSIGLIGNRIKSPELENALKNVAPYTKTEFEEYILEKEISDDEVTVIKLVDEKTGENEEWKDLLFLVFRNGELEDTYYTRKHILNSELENLSLSSAEKVALKFVKEVYGIDIQFDEKIRRGSSYIEDIRGALCEFSGNYKNKKVRVVISLNSGIVYHSSIYELWETDWEYFAEAQSDPSSNRVAISDDLIFINQGVKPIDIYPYSGNRKSIDLQDYSFKYTSSYVQLNNQEIKRSNLNTFFNENLDILTLNTRETFYQQAVSAIQFLFNQDLNNEEKMIQLRKSMLSEAALRKFNKLDWLSQWKEVSKFINGYSKGGYNYQASGSGSYNGGYYILENEFVNGSDGHKIVELIEVIEENGKFKVNDYHLIPDQSMWKTKGKESEEEVVSLFIEIMKSKDTESLMKMMPYNQSMSYNLLDFIMEKVEGINLKSLEVQGSYGTARIEYKRINSLTDSMGTNHNVEEIRDYYLKLVKDECGWLLYDYSFGAITDTWWKTEPFEGVSINEQ